MTRRWPTLFVNSEQGPLPSLLLGLTVLTGVVDSVSILSLGRVFVANMTGNVVFVGFGLAGAPGFSLSSSLSALAGFLVGAFAGGALITRVGTNRGVLLRDAVAIELVLFAVGLTVATTAAKPLGVAARDEIAAVTAVALGIQNSVARRLAVPDMTTTVLTMTLTGIASDVRHGNPVVAGRRLLAVAAMLGGAVAGASLVLKVSPEAALGLGVGILAVVTVGATAVARRPAAWNAPGGRA